MYERFGVVLQQERLPQPVKIGFAFDDWDIDLTLFCAPRRADEQGDFDTLQCLKAGLNHVPALNLFVSAERSVRRDNAVLLGIALSTYRVDYRPFWFRQEQA